MQAGGFNGNFAGQGVLRRSNGYVYDGEWSAGMKHGHGVEESACEMYTVCPCQALQAVCLQLCWSARAAKQRQRVPRTATANVLAVHGAVAWM